MGEHIVRCIPQVVSYRVVFQKSLYGVLINPSFVDEIDRLYEKGRFRRMNIRSVGRLARDGAAGEIVNNFMIINCC